MKNILCISIPMQAAVAILFLVKVDFKLKLIRRDKNGHYILLTGIIQQKENNTSKYICTEYCKLYFVNQILLDIKDQIKTNTVMLSDLNIPLSQIDQTDKN